MAEGLACLGTFRAMPSRAHAPGSLPPKVDNSGVKAYTNIFADTMVTQKIVHPAWTRVARTQSRAPGGQVAHMFRLGTTWTIYMGRLCGHTKGKSTMGKQCNAQAVQGSHKASWATVAETSFWMWNITSLRGREPEVLRQPHCWSLLQWMRGSSPWCLRLQSGRFWSTIHGLRKGRRGPLEGGKKAYNCVPWEAVWQVLWEYGGPEPVQ